MRQVLVAKLICAGEKSSAEWIRAHRSTVKNREWFHKFVVHEVKGFAFAPSELEEIGEPNT